MKTATLAMGLAIAALVCAHNAAAGTLRDDFNGSAIDTGLWQVTTPFGDSSVTESGGNAVFANRGRLLTRSTFPTPLDITGRFSITGNIRDQLSVLTRTNGTSTNAFGEFDQAIAFLFQIQNDGGDTTNNIKIARFGYPGPSPILITGTFPLALNTTYDFRCTDDGTNLALYLNNLATPFLTASDPTVIAQQVAIYNREGAGAAGSVSRVDFIQIVPEPAAGIVGLASAVSLLPRRRRFQRRRLVMDRR